MLFVIRMFTVEEQAVIIEMFIIACISRIEDMHDTGIGMHIRYHHPVCLVAFLIVKCEVGTVKIVEFPILASLEKDMDDFRGSEQEVGILVSGPCGISSIVCRSRIGICLIQSQIYFLGTVYGSQVDTVFRDILPSPLPREYVHSHLGEFSFIHIFKRKRHRPLHPVPDTIITASEISVDGVFRRTDDRDVRIYRIFQIPETVFSPGTGKYFSKGQDLEK